MLRSTFDIFHDWHFLIGLVNKNFRCISLHVAIDIGEDKYFRWFYIQYHKMPRLHIYNEYLSMY